MFKSYLFILDFTITQIAYVTSSLNFTTEVVTIYKLNGLCYAVTDISMFLSTEATLVRVPHTTVSAL